MTANNFSSADSLIERVDDKLKERGFNCMMLIRFLTESDLTDWDDWHGAHIAASTGHCRFAERCPIYLRTIAGSRKHPIQLSLF